MPRHNSRHPLLSLAIAATVIILPLQTKAAVPNQSLIKSQTDAAVYYVEGGKRYAFPTERVYLSWYPDFSSVITVADTELALYPLAGNITYRPTSQLIKITTDPKVYAVAQYGVLRWVKTEVVAKQLYGADWNTKVDDIADTFFINYLVGTEINVTADYNLNEEGAVKTLGQNMRPAGYAPPLPSITAPVATNPALISVVVSMSQATLNQKVQVTATVSDSNRPISKIEMYNDQSANILATCLNSLNCSFTYTVMQAPLIARFRAVAVDDLGARIDTPLGQRAELNVPSVSSNIQMSVTPMELGAGSKASFNSNAATFANITSHKVYAAIPGEPNPVLWRDCGVENFCAAATPFYRTTQLFSRVVTGGQTYQSASVTVTVTNGEPPKPTLTATKLTTPSQVKLKLTAPSVEMVGWSSIVEGTSADENAIALCPLTSCEITVQISKPTTFIAFTDVGGKLEASNSVTVAP